MSKGLYTRRINKLDTCEKKGCSKKAIHTIMIKGVIWKRCKEHMYKGMLCNNCGCILYSLEKKG